MQEVFNNKHAYLKNKQSFQSAASEQGSTIVQFALVVPLVLFLLLGFIDLVKIYSVKTILQAGVEDGMRVARTVTNLDIDTRNLSPGEYDYYRYQWAKEKVMSAAESLPLSSLVGEPGSGKGWAELIPFKHGDSGEMTNAALLRPYECAKADTGALKGCTAADKNCLRHPSLEDTTPCGDFLGVDSTNLKNEPVVVVMRARVKTFLPVFDNMVLEAKTTGFRPKIPKAEVDLTKLLPSTTSSSTTTSSSSTTSSSTTTLTTPPTEPEECVPTPPGDDIICSNDGFVFDYSPSECRCLY